MATQGVFSIVRGGKVWAKVVCGCDGDRIGDLADRYFQAQGVEDETTGARLYEMARQSGVGCGDCLVVMVATGRLTKPIVITEVEEEIGHLYYSTFHVPDFNPRWERGTAPYILVACEVDLVAYEAEIE